MTVTLPRWSLLALALALAAPVARGQEAAPTGALSEAVRAEQKHKLRANAELNRLEPDEIMYRPSPPVTLTMLLRLSFSTKSLNEPDP